MTATPPATTTCAVSSGPEHISAILARLPCLNNTVAPPHTHTHIDAMSTETITLPQACVKLRMTRDEVMRMIYRGELEAEQLPNGRWRVSAASVDTHK